MSLMRRLAGFVRLYLGLVALGAICLTWTPLALLLYPLLPARAGRLLGRWVISHGFRMYLGGLSLMGAPAASISMRSMRCAAAGR